MPIKHILHTAGGNIMPIIVSAEAGQVFIQVTGALEGGVYSRIDRLEARSHDLVVGAIQSQDVR